MSAVFFRGRAPVAVVIGALVFIVLAVELGAIHVAAHRADEIARALEDRVAERQTFRQAAPALEPEAAREISRRLEEETARLQAARAPWRVPRIAGGTDLWVQVGRFVTESTTRLRAGGVRVAADERFGLAAEIAKPPRETERAWLEHELALLETAASALRESGAMELRGVRRCPLASGDRRMRSTEGGASWERLPKLERARIELTFSGDARALRRFLAALSVAEPRVWLETVEVEAVSAGANARVAAVVTVCLSRPRWPENSNREKL